MSYLFPTQSRAAFSCRRSAWLHSCVAGLLAVAASSCGDGGSGLPADTLPPEWAGARSLKVEQSTCQGSALSAAVPGLELSATGADLIGAYRDAQFRCGPQELCGYLQEEDATTRVLVQPCDLHPTSVAKCVCLYQVTFTLPARTQRSTVELYRRFDFYGATEPPAAMLVDSKPVD